MLFTLAEQNFIIALIFASAFFLISLYHLLLFFSTQETIYRDYFVFLIAITSYTCVYILTPISPNIADTFSIPSAGFTAFGSLLFVKTFLGLTKIKHANLNIFFNRMMFFSLFAVLMHAINWFFAFGYNDGLSIFLAFITLFSLLLEVFSGVWLMRKEENARLFMITSAPLFVGALIYLFAWFYLQEQQLTWFRVGLYGSLMLQMILFSTVIGKRLNNYKQAQLDVQKSRSERLTAEVASKISEIEAQRKELENLNKFKTKLLALVSHDIRNPLTSLIGIITIIEKNAMNKEELGQHIATVKNKITHSVYTLSRILSWSFSQLEGAKIDQRKISLLDIVLQNQEFYADTAKEKNITIEITIDKSHSVMIDEEMFNTVIRNLLSNALKFSEKKGKIEIYSYEKYNKTFLVICDHGIGMSADYLERVMNNTEPISSVDTSGEQGFGFGLKMSQDFLQMNNANLTYESEEGKGTTFTLEMLSVTP
jgi:signal transduction histidine kinase